MSVTLVTFGSAAGDSGNLPVEGRQVHRGAGCRVAQADAHVLAEVLRASPDIAVALCDAEVIPEGHAWKSATHIWNSDSTAQAGLFWLPVAAPRVVATWCALPSKPAALLFPPERFAVVVLRRAAIESIGGFRDVAAPLWDACIRIAQAGGRIVSLNAEQAARSAANVATAGPAEQWLPRLVPQRPGSEREWLRAHLSSVRWDDASEAERPMRTDVAALQAGFWQMHDFLEESHRESQGIEGLGVHRHGDYWHAIMHRREPDSSNAKYWFRRVGAHPIFPKLYASAAGIFRSVTGAEAREWSERVCARGSWDPFAFVDLCATFAADESGSLAVAARYIQLAEMLLLLEATYAASVGEAKGVK